MPDSRSSRTVFTIFLIFIAMFTIAAFAQSGLESRVNEVINNLVRIINVLIIGFIVWAGFLIAKGDASGLNRLIFGVIGLIVANAANLIINYFR